MDKCFCKYCGTPLGYKQKKFCSKHCQAVGYRLDWTEEKRAETNRNISKAAQKRCQNPQDRINFFKQNGYDCLVVWASELKNQNETIDKVKSFLGTKEV